MNMNKTKQMKARLSEAFSVATERNAQKNTLSLQANK